MPNEIHCHGPAEGLQCFVGHLPRAVRAPITEGTLVGPQPLARRHLWSRQKLVAAPWAADILTCLPPKGLFSVLGERVMSSSVMAELDFIEELRLRRWARENYVPRGERKHSWHPVIK